MKVKYLFVCLLVSSSQLFAQEGIQERAYLVQTLTRIAEPVFTSLGKNELKKNMPIEKFNGMQSQHPSTHLEAFARMLAGMAPWLELGPDATSEGKLRKKYMALALQCIHNGTDTTSPDYLGFQVPGQSLVDAAFLSQALLRAPKQLMGQLDAVTKNNLITALKLTRATRPPQNNWLLFAAMIETCLWKLTGECDQSRIEYAIQKHKDWYKGDGVYGDGADFHFDYYNSFVIHPMLIDILRVMQERNIPMAVSFETELKRAMRYAAILERMISPEATYPVTGRSIAYRFGNFQLLSQMALQHTLPEQVSPAQVRSALYTMIRKQIEAPGTFDAKGWLQIGIYGHQPGIGEHYISTGSLYLCSQAFLLLGLPASDSLWQEKDADWTAKKVWKGEQVPIDHAISN